MRFCDNSTRMFGSIVQFPYLNAQSRTGRALGKIGDFGRRDWGPPGYSALCPSAISRDWRENFQACCVCGSQTANPPFQAEAADD